MIAYRSAAWSVALIVGVVLLLTTPTAVSSVPSPSTTASSFPGPDFAPSSPQPAGPLISLTEAVGTVQAAYQSLSNSTVNASSLPSAATVGAEIWSAYGTVSQQPTFASLNSSLGPNAFTLQVGNNISTGVTHAYFGFNYRSGSQEILRYWDADLPAYTITGPLTTAGPAGSGGAANYSNGNDVNWAGTEDYVDSCPVGHCPLGDDDRTLSTVQSVYTDQVYPTVTNESTTHILTNATTAHVSQDVAIWAGLETDTGVTQGQTGRFENWTILQAGYVTGSNNSSGKWYGGTPWYELNCAGFDFECMTGWQLFTGMGHASSGDRVSELVKWSGAGNHYVLEDKDYTTSAYALLNYSLSPWFSNAVSFWATDEMLEAPGYYYPSCQCTYIQELPDFGTVNFYDVTICITRDSSSCFLPSQTGITYPTGWVDIVNQSEWSYLSQACAKWSGSVCDGGYSNAIVSYSSGSGGVFSESDYSSVGWGTSEYDGNFVCGTGFYSGCDGWGGGYGQPYYPILPISGSAVFGV
jgi:hypothetical protein